jgi:peptide/nickel transport system permease protein
MNIVHRLLGHPQGRVAAVILFALTGMALAGPFLPGDSADFVGSPHQPPSWQAWLGTTGQGQDVLHQTVEGALPSLALAGIVGALCVLIGAFIGVTAATFGGVVDDLLNAVTNVALLLPGLPLAILIATFLPSGQSTLALVLVATGWAWHARVFRAASSGLVRRDFVAAAVAGGAGKLDVIVRELLPNLKPLLLSSFIGATMYALGAEVGLEFLGLGDVAKVTWGTNLYWASNDAALITGAWWTFVPTGACLAAVAFALALMNGALDDASNPALAAEAALRRAVPGFQPNAPTPVVRDA